jgi:hypothetical protein
MILLTMSVGVSFAQHAKAKAAIGAVVATSEVMKRILRM